MGNELKKMIGGKVTNIFQIHDSWRLEFDIGALNSYNPLFHCKRHIMLPFEAGFRSEYIGRQIISVKCKDRKNLIMTFDNRNKLIISLTDESYTGPEAACVVLNSGEIFVY
jgi:hypothetical protein